MDTVSVGRLTVNCDVPRDHPNPLAVRTKIDEVAAGPLQAALGQLLAPLAKLGDEVIVIPRLELDFDLDLSGSPVEVARRWAARLAAALAAYLQPTAHTAFARFPDQAHYLARFLADAVAGRAHVWYHRRYQGLTALPRPALLRSAILDEPVRGLLALRALPPSELQEVLAALGPREARRILETIGGGVAVEVDGVAAVLAPLVEAWRPQAAAQPSPWSAALLLLAQASEALQPHELQAAARLAAALAAFCAERLQAQVRRRSREERIAARLDGAGLPDQGPLLSLSPARRQALLGESAPDAIEAAPSEWYTRFGGLLLLLPRIAELPQIFDREPDRAALRLLLLARAAGVRRAAAVLADPLLRHICGAQADLDLDEWLAAEAPRIAALLPAALWRRAFSRATSIRLEVTRHREWGPLLVAVSEPDGDWLGFAPPQRALLRGPVWEGIAFHPSLPAARAAARVLDHVVAGTSPAEPAFALAAQQVLRAFARRLPGFADSSPRHLYENFLDFDATVVENAGTFHCRVGRPRLAAIFGLTGALRGRIPLGFGGLALELYPGG